MALMAEVKTRLLKPWRVPPPDLTPLAQKVAVSIPPTMSEVRLRVTCVCPHMAQKKCRFRGTCSGAWAKGKARRCSCRSSTWISTSHRCRRSGSDPFRARGTAREPWQDKCRKIVWKLRHRHYRRPLLLYKATVLGWATTVENIPKSLLGIVAATHILSIPCTVWIQFVPCTENEVSVVRGIPPRSICGAMRSLANSFFISSSLSRG